MDGSRIQMFSPFFDWRRGPLHSRRGGRGPARLSPTRPRLRPDQPDILALRASLLPGPDIGPLRVADQRFSGLVFQTGFLMGRPISKTRAPGFLTPEARACFIGFWNRSHSGRKCRPAPGSRSPPLPPTPPTGPGWENRCRRERRRVFS